MKEETFKYRQKTNETLFSKQKIDHEKINSENNIKSNKTEEDFVNHSSDQVVKIGERKKISFKIDKENKQKFKGGTNENHDLIKYLGKITAKDPPFIPNYVFMTPSEPASKHHFRTIEKDKWLSHNNFKV